MSGTADLVWLAANVVGAAAGIAIGILAANAIL